MLPNTDGGAPSQVSIQVVSRGGAFASGMQDGSAPAGCGGLVFTDGLAGDVHAPARINTHGRGLLHFDGAVLCSVGEPTGNQRPFIFTSNTTVWLDRSTVWADKTKDNACDDVIRFGGRTTVFGARAASPFQGYGSRVSGCFFQGVRSIKIQAYGNSIVIDRNTWWARCGSPAAYDAEGYGAAIVIDGHANDAPDQYAVGTLVLGNLIECPGFKYGVYAEWASHAQIIGNHCYDETAITLAGVYLGANTSNCTVIAGLAPAGLPYLVGPGARINNTYIGAYEGDPSYFPSFKAGRAGYPARLTYALFDGSSTEFQPENVGLADGIYTRLKRPAFATVEPDALIVETGGRGAVAWGSGAIAGGNETVSNASQVERWNNGREWGFGRPGNVRAGGAMGHHTGTGGSDYTARQYRYDMLDHTGVRYARFGNVGGGVGAATLQLGESADVEVFRASSATVKCNVAYAPAAFATVGLPSAVTAGAGAFVWDSTISAFVLSDGTIWKRFGVSSINPQTGVAYTLAIGDAENVVDFTNAAAIALTVPTHAAVAFPVGTYIELHAGGAGQVTISGAGVTLQSRGGLLNSAGQYAVIGLRKIGTNTWRVFGDLA